MRVAFRTAYFIIQRKSMKRQASGVMTEWATAIGQRWNDDKMWQNVPTVFVVIALAFGIFFAIKTPPLWGNDETAEFARAYQISQGHVLPSALAHPHDGSIYGASLPASVVNLITHVNDDVRGNANETSYGTRLVGDPAAYQTLAQQKLNARKVSYDFPTIEVHSPLAYASSAVGVWIASLMNFNVGNAVLLARLLTLALYVMCVTLALRALKGTRFAWVVAAVALAPMALFEASMVSADATANALAILLISLVAKTFLGKGLSKGECWELAAATVLLPLVKSDYMVIALSVLLVQASRLAWPKAIIVGASVVCTTVWAYVVRGVSIASSNGTHINEHQQLLYVTHHVAPFGETIMRTLLLQDGTYANGIFGFLSAGLVQVPAFSTVATALAIVVALGLSERLDVPRGKRWWLFGLTVAGVATVFASLYLSFSRVGAQTVEGVEGQYFLPFVLLFFVALLASKRKFSLKRTDLQAAMTGRAVACLSAFSLLFAAWRLLYVLF